MSNIMVSVIMLCYNHEKYLREAIESVVNQKTSFDYELIIHDDASTDGSQAIIREYQAKYPQIIHAILQEENQYSKKVPIRRTFIDPVIRGKYIASCEGDDYWSDENKLQSQVDFLESHEDYVGCTHNCSIIDKAGNKTNLRRKVYPLCREHTYTLLPYEVNSYFPGQTAAMMYRKSAWDLSDQRWESYMKMRTRSGDQKRNLHLLCQGSIYYMEKEMSAHRVVVDEGDSWSARNRNNRTYEKFVSSIDFRRYAKAEFGKTFWNYNSTSRAVVEAVKKALTKPNQENKQALKKIAAEKKGYVPLAFYTLGLLVVSVPLEIIKKILKERNVVKGA